MSKDSVGNILSTKQEEFFKNSKIRDKNGNLLVMYHGTKHAGFTEFSISDVKDGGFFFTDDESTARGYSNTYDNFKYLNKNDFTDFEDFIQAVEDFADVEAKKKYTSVSADDYYDKYKGVPTYETPMEVLSNEPNAETVYEVWYISDEYGEQGPYWEGEYEQVLSEIDFPNDYNANYRCYLNITNPYIIYGNGDNWDEIREHDDSDIVIDDSNIDNLYEMEDSEIEKLMDAWNDVYMDDFSDRDEFIEYISKKLSYNGIILDETYYPKLSMSTRDWVLEVQSMDEYDGIIFVDIIDSADGYSGESTVVVAFKPNQIKSIYNKQPTNSNDITEILQESEASDREQLIQKVLQNVPRFQKYPHILKTKSKDELLGILNSEHTKKQVYKSQQNNTNRIDTDIHHEKCVKCGTELTDGGYCPICDIGEEDYR